MRDGPGAGAVEGLAGPVKDQAPERQRQFRAACFRQDAGVRLGELGGYKGAFRD